MQSYLTKYIHKDVALIIMYYMETDTDYYQISHYVTDRFLLQTATLKITRGASFGPDLYYIFCGLQKINNNLIEPIITQMSPRAIAICDMWHDDMDIYKNQIVKNITCQNVMFIVTYESAIIIYNCNWQPIYTYHIGLVYTCTSSAYGSALYLTYTHYVSEKSNMPYGQLIKLILGPSGRLYELKRIKQAPNSQVLASNIDYVCVKAGNKIIIYRSDTLQKTARVNIGMAIMTHY